MILTHRATLGTAAVGSARSDAGITNKEAGMSVLAFRTPPGGVKIPAGQSKELGVVDVSKYSKIRVVADERIGSGSGVTLRLTMTEGNELVAQLDTPHLAPHSQFTREYEVPGTKLSIFADALAGSGSDGVDVLIYAN
jgi:type III secretion protein HrpB1